MLESVEQNNSASKTKSTIRDIQTVSEIEAFLDEDCALVWDIDNTILETNQLLGSDQWFAHYIAQKVSEDLSIQDAVQAALRIYVPVQQSTGIRVVEPTVVDLIKSAQAKGMVTFCLTSRGDYIQEATIEQLASIGLDFNQGIFKDISLKIQEGTERTLSHGVIFAEGGRHKGACLKTVLEKIETLKPKKIVMIDDKKSYLDNVALVCQELGIEFVGLRYGYLDEKIEKLNVDIVQKQLEKYHNPILTDEEAQLLVRAEKHHCGIVLNEEKHRGLLWGSGINFETYQKIIELDPGMKAFRRGARYLDVDGRQELCFRFKIPLEDLQRLWPKIENAGLIEKSELESLKEQLDTLLLKGNQPCAVVYQFNAHRQQQTTDDKPQLLAPSDFKHKKL